MKVLRPRRLRAAIKPLLNGAPLLCATLLSLLMVVGPAHAAAPMTLQQAIAAALHGNPDLQTFSYRFKVQEARGQQAALQPAPEVSLEVENALGTGETKGFKSAETTFALSQVIELGGKRDARVGAAQAGIGVLDVARQSAQLDVLAEVTRRFIAVAQRQEMSQLAASAADLAQKTVDAAERRVNAAKSPHAELDRAKVALDRARLDVSRAASQLDGARTQLAAMWGDVGATIDGQSMGVVTANLFEVPAPGDFESLATLLASNPDVLRFASEERLRDAELRLASTQRKPDLSFSGGIRRLEASNDEAFVGSVSIPLFGQRRSQGFIAEAQANRDLVGVERRAAEVKARAALYELYRDLTQAVTEAKALQTQVAPRVKEALDETQYAYDRGRYSYLELVDAQREYLSTRADLIEASSQAHRLRAEIERLTNAPLAVLPK